MNIVTIPIKQDGDYLLSSEINDITRGLNDTYAAAKSPSHSFAKSDFIISGARAVDGKVVPVIKINQDYLNSIKTIVDLSQFDGDGSIDSPYKLNESAIGDLQLSTPDLTLSITGQTTMGLVWLVSNEATSYTAQRATNSTFTAGLSNVYTGPNLAFNDTGLTESTLYYYRVQATAAGHIDSHYSVNSATTSSAGATTPDAPTAVSNNIINTQSFTHALGNSEIVVSVNEGAYIQLTAVSGWNSTTGVIDVGNVARSSGYYKAKIKAATGRNESSSVNSAAFTIAAVSNYLPGYSPLEIDNGLFRYGSDPATMVSPGIWEGPDDQSNFLILTKYTFNHLSEIAFKAPIGFDYELGMGLMDEYVLKDRTATLNVWNDETDEPGLGGIYIQTGSDIADLPSPPVLASDEYLVLRFMSAPGAADEDKELLAFRTTDGNTFIPIPLPERVNNLTAPLNYVVFELIVNSQQVLYPQGKGLTLQP